MNKMSKMIKKEVVVFHQIQSCAFFQTFFFVFISM